MIIVRFLYNCCPYCALAYANFTVSVPAAIPACLWVFKGAKSFDIQATLRKFDPRDLSLWDGGFYFVRVMKLCNEAVVAERYDFGCNFCFAPSLLTKEMGREGRNNKYTRNCTV